jgi:outer membrane receptor protein involved in Fe transport
MKAKFLGSACAAAFICLPAVATAQTGTGSDEGERARSTTPSVLTNAPIIVTATRREVLLQDVPLSITAFQQEELTERGVVGYEGLAQNTPGVVVNRPTANFNNFTARGIATNGYGANLQGTVAIYIDELPISANGNSTILDPNLYDVERVEFLRGPQGTLFGSNSLAGAVRIITHAPNTRDFEASALADWALTGDDSFRQRYNAMVNVPLVEDRLAIRAVGFYRHEDGYVDNIGTGIENSNTLEDVGGRIALLWEPTDRLSIRLGFSYEDSTPEDSSLIIPTIDRNTRLSDRPDLFHAELTTYNATVEYDFDGFDFISSSTYAMFDQLFVVDLAGTFGQLIPFALDAYAYDDIFVEEARLTSDPGGSFDWVLGVFYYDKRRDVDYNYRSSPEFLAARGLTGLNDEYYQRFGSHFNSSELAGFGELTYRFTDNFWITGGLRYTSTSVQSFTEPGGYTSNYLGVALGGFSNIPLTVTPVAAVTGLKVTDSQASYKVSVSWQPSDAITTYATISTGFRSPVVNARAGLVSTLDPTDIVIPDGADSDSLTNYEVGLKGVWLGGDLTANIAAYYIDWRDIQVQANRVSDSIQFATNIGGAVSKGIELELLARPWAGVSINLVGSLNDSKVTDLTAAEAAISGAVDGVRLASPHFQGSATVRYDFPISANANGWTAFNISHAGSFPGLFPNVPGQPGVINPTYDFTESWENVNIYFGANVGDLRVTAYVENLFNDRSITYVHPEAFIASRYATLRPRTIGVRVGYDF